MIPRHLPFPFRQVMQCLGVGFPLLLSAVPTVAQPSGGPYGPVERRYEIPETGRIYYVAPDGKSDSPGSTVDQPTTLESAMAQVVTGNAIILRGGLYRTGGLKLNQGITMQPFEDEQPVLKGTKVATEWEPQPNGTWRTSWTRLFPAQPADWWRSERNIARTPLHLFNNDMVFVDDELLGAVGSLEDVGEKTYYIDYENGFIHIGTDPGDRLVEITDQNNALIRTTREVHGKKNDRKGPAIRGIIFTQYARLALEVEGTEPGEYMDPSNFGKEVVGTTLENLTISFCSRVAGYFRGDGLTIRNCLVSDCGTEGIYVVNSADVLLEKNIVTRTNVAENFTGYFASAVKIFNQSHRTICRDNLVIDNPHTAGVWYDVGNVDGVFINNWVENVETGFFFEISKGAVCAGNVFVNCSPGIRILNSSNVQVYQNTLFNSQVQFDRSDRSSAAGDHFGWHASSGPDVEERHGHEFVNNLLVSDDTFARPLLSFHQRESLREVLKDPQVSKLDGNVYVTGATATSQPLIIWNPAPTETGSISIATIDELRTMHPEFEAKAEVFESYEGPLFADPGSDNFELMHSFRGSGAGVPLPTRIRDLLELKSDKDVFPGAYSPR